MRNYSLNDLTKGNLPVQILLFSLPLIFSNLLQVLFNLADISVVGIFAGSDALGAVGSTTTLVTLFTTGLIGLSAGINVLVARYIGTKNETGVKEIVHSSFVVSFSMGIILLLIGVFLSKPVLILLNTKEELIDLALTYLRIYFIGMPFLAIYNFGNAVFSANGDTKKPLVFLSISGVLNVLGNLFFVCVLKLSVVGVALASCISQFTSAILILVALTKSTDVIALTMNTRYIQGYRIEQILRLGIPAMFQNMIFQIANLFVQKGVNTFPTIYVKGNSAAINSDNIVYCVMDGFYIACGSFIGQNLGAKNKKRILQSYFISLAYSFSSGLLLGGGLALLGTKFLMLFTSEIEVAKAGLTRLTIMGLSYCVSAFMDDTIAASRGLGYSATPTIFVLLGSCVFRVVWIETIFAYFKSMQSLYLLYVFSWTLTSIMEIWYFCIVYKKSTKDI